MATGCFRTSIQAPRSLIAGPSSTTSFLLTAMPGSLIELAFNLCGIGFGRRCLSRSGVPLLHPRSSGNCLILQEVLSSVINTGPRGHVGQLSGLYPSGNPGMPAIRQVQRGDWCPKTLTTLVGLADQAAAGQIHSPTVNNTINSESTNIDRKDIGSSTGSAGMWRSRGLRSARVSA